MDTRAILDLQDGESGQLVRRESKLRGRAGGMSYRVLYPRFFNIQKGGGLLCSLRFYYGGYSITVSAGGALYGI